MRVSSLVLLLLAAAAVPPRAGRSPDGRHVAEVRRCAGGEALFLDGTRIWPARARCGARISAPPAWSPRGDAVAFAARERDRTSLLVHVVEGDAAPLTLVWTVPRAAEPARAVTWLGVRRVGVGPDELAPRATATWRAGP